MPIRTWVLTAAAALLAAGAPDPARATNLYVLEGFGAASRALGGAGHAVAIGTGSMMTNPATIGLIAPGETRLELGFEVVNTNDLDTINRATGEIAHSRKDSYSRASYAPHFGVISRWNKLALGFSSFVQGGLGSDYGTTSFLSRLPSGIDTGLDIESKLAVMRVPFAASYEALPGLRVGASLDFLYVGASFQTLLGADQIGFLAGQGAVTGSLLPTLAAIAGPTGGAYVDFHKSNDLATGTRGLGGAAKIGVVYDIDDETRVGVAYHSESVLTDLTGRADMIALTPAGARVPLNGKVRVVNFETPAQIGGGVARTFLGGRLLVAADISRVFWSQAVRSIRVRFQDGAGAGDLDVRIPQRLEDITIVAFGAQYSFSEKLRGRVGGRWGPSGVSRSEELPVAPYHLGKHVSAGFGWSIDDRHSVDFAYSHVFGQRVSSDGPPNASAVAPITIDHAQDNLILTYGYKY